MQEQGLSQDTGLAYRCCQSLQRLDLPRLFIQPAKIAEQVLAFAMQAVLLLQVACGEQGKGAPVIIQRLGIMVLIACCIAGQGQTTARLGGKCRLLAVVG